MFVFLTPQALFGSVRILAFNWGYSQGIKKAMSAAEHDGQKTEKGYRIGPHFWKSLYKAQSDADHRAGDGLYFSTLPFDSSRFGPSLMIVEIEIENPQDVRLINSMTAEAAQAHPDELPTIVRYRGNWHVVKSLPRDHKIKIWVRTPTQKDIEEIFRTHRLNTDLTQVLNFITHISHRYSMRFRRFEPDGQIPKSQQANRSTQKYIEHFIDLLVDHGLSSGTVDFNDPEKLNHFTSALLQTLQNLSQISDEKKVFNRNMTKKIYKKLI